MRASACARALSGAPVPEKDCSRKLRRPRRHRPHRDAGPKSRLGRSDWETLIAHMLMTDSIIPLWTLLQHSRGTWLKQGRGHGACDCTAGTTGEATMRMAGNLGFETYVVADACFTFAKPDYKGQLRSADEVHAMSLANLNGEYCTVLEAEALLRDVHPLR